MGGQVAGKRDEDGNVGGHAAGHGRILITGWLFGGHRLFEQLIGRVVWVLLLPLGKLGGKLLRVLPQGLLQDGQLQPAATDVRRGLLDGLLQLRGGLRQQKAPDRRMVVGPLLGGQVIFQGHIGTQGV